MSTRVAVMDLGTNTFHLLIAELEKGSFKILHRERQPVKIGKGGINQGSLQPDAIGRALACMESFGKTMNAMQVKRYGAYGTSALRSSANGSEVINQIKSKTGISVELISGDQEAIFIYHGIQAALDLGPTPSLVVDIGGGSVEFIIADREKILWKVSLNIGAQRLLEQFHRHDPMRAEELSGLDDYYAKALVPVLEAVRKFRPDTLVGSSGTFDTLSEMYCVANGIPYHSEQPETPLTVEAFLHLHAELISKNRLDRLKIPGMIEMRVDMIVVASCLINHLVAQLSFTKIRVSSWSLKEGVLALMASEQNTG